MIYAVCFFKLKKKIKILNMKTVLLILALSLFVSCVSVRFPETIKVDINVPENFDVEKMQILIDTLRSQKVDGTIEFQLHSKDNNES